MKMNKKDKGEGKREIDIREIKRKKSETSGKKSRKRK
jgi:hypothetical protein